MNEEKGTWIIKHRYATLWYFMCSECKKTCPHSFLKEPTNKFCPHCGKSMNVKGDLKCEKEALFF
jgi:rRNA maturation endonuclease Nob1